MVCNPAAPTGPRGIPGLSPAVHPFFFAFDCAGAPIKNETFLCNFKGADTGKIFESPTIEIGMKFEFKGQHGRATLYVLLRDE